VAAVVLVVLVVLVALVMCAGVGADDGRYRRL